MRTDYEHLLIEKADGVLTITMNRPEIMNAVNGVMHSELADVFHQARDDDARVIVLTGAGEAFQATGDVDWFPTIGRDEWLRTIRQVRWIIRDMMLIEQPLIVKLNGRAAGVGASMALAGDLIYAAEEASLVDPHVGFALAAGDGAAAFLPHLVSLTKAKEMLFFGRDLTGRDLFDLGIANKVVPRAELDDVVREAALELAAMPPQALRWTKMIVNKCADLSVTTTMDQAAAYEGWGWELPEFKDALGDGAYERGK